MDDNENKKEFTIEREEINKLPIKAFEGNIHLIDSDSIALETEIKLSSNSIIGVDTETRPSFTKGKVNQISLIQVSNETDAYLFRLNLLNVFPDVLKKIFENKKIIKIGQDPQREFKELNEKYKINFENVIDIAILAKKLECSPKSLRALCAIFLNFRISKSMQTSNWEKEVLTEKQMLYAATDAWVPLKVYKKMLKYLGQIPKKE